MISLFEKHGYNAHIRIDDFCHNKQDSFEFDMYTRVFQFSKRQYVTYIRIDTRK